MKYLLDSNTVSDFYDKSSPDHAQVVRKLAELSDQDEVYISILTVYELEYGYANAPEDKKPVIRQKIKEAQQDFQVLPLSAQSAELFGALKKALKEVRTLSQENIKKHNIDLMLASTALTEQCTLVSADRIYREIQPLKPELKIQNWALSLAIPLAP